MNYLELTPKQANDILVQTALCESIINQNNELEALIREQILDDTGRAKGEFLGGNGQAQPHHCKPRGEVNILIDSTHDSEVTHIERLILSYSIDEHQTGIEDNGQYNVRQLAHWKGGFNPDKFAKFQARIAKKLADHGVKVDKRKAITPEALERKQARLTMSNKDYQKMVRRQRKAKQ